MSKVKRRQKVTSWEDMKPIFNESRVEILDLCKSQARSIKDLSELLNLNPGSVHNHIKKLEASGYLEVVETRIVNGIVEKKYLRTAIYYDFIPLQGKENKIKANYISSALKRESLKIMTDDPEASSRKIKVKLSKKNYKVVIKKLNELLDFIVDADEDAGVSTGFVFCLGKKGGD